MGRDVIPNFLAWIRLLRKLEFQQCLEQVKLDGSGVVSNKPLNFAGFWYPAIIIEKFDNNKINFENRAQLTLGLLKKSFGLPCSSPPLAVFFFFH